MHKGRAGVMVIQPLTQASQQPIQPIPRQGEIPGQGQLGPHPQFHKTGPPFIPPSPRLGACTDEAIAIPAEALG